MDQSSLRTFITAAVALVLILSSLPSSLKNSFSIVHQVPEGHVGVYWRGGALLKAVTEPGFHLKMPFITQHELVQVSIQTYTVTNIPCGTKGGVMINFEKIQVVNRIHKEYVYETLLNYGVHYMKTWIHDKIHQEICHFFSSRSLQQVYIDGFDQIGEMMKEALEANCARYALGIEIISVLVPKPTLPDSIRRNFEQLEVERIKVLITISEAEKNANVSKILNQMHLAREKSMADANFYRATKEAEANRLKLTPEFLVLKYIEAIGGIRITNNKTSCGDKVLISSPCLSLPFQCLQLLSRFLLARLNIRLF